MKVSTVIVIFCYNRLAHLKKTLKSLKKNHNYSKYKIYIFSDGPKNETDKKKIYKLRKYINSLNQNKFTIIEYKKNLGLKRNVITGMNKIFKKFKSAIIIEDDLILGPQFLNYMSQMLKFFEKDKKIGSISAYTPIKSKDFNFTNNDIYLSKRHFSWGWATWSHVWNSFTLNEKKLKKSINKKNLKKFSKIGNDLPILLDLSIKNEISSWSIFFDFNCSLRNLFCVCPKYSIVENMGFDNSGTHTHQNFLNNESKKKWSPKNFKKPIFSEKIANLERTSIEGSLIQKIKNKFLIIKDLLYKNK